MRRAACPLLLVAALAADPPPAQCQTVAGALLEAETDRPIAFGNVSIVDEDGRTVASTVSDVDGHFLLHLDGPGAVRIHASRLGYYSAVSTPFEVGDEGLVTVAIRLAINPVAVDSIHVVVGRPATLLEAEGFYRRQKTGLGTFLTRYDIQELRGARDITDVLRYVPGTRIRMDPFGKERVQLRGNQRAWCSPLLILDGVRVEPPWEDLVELDALEGVEVYDRPMVVPGRFGGILSCGVVVAWSRPPLRGQ